jgi:hypothetical protein
MGKVALAVLAACLGAMEAEAGTTLKVPADASPESAFIIKDLPDAVLATDRFFSVTVPKGWTVTSVGPSDRFLSDITIAASSDLEFERTYLGVHALRVPVKKTVEQKYAEEKGRLKPNEKLDYETWQGRKWLVKEYPCQSGQMRSAARCWAAWTYAGAGRAGMLVASTPTLQTSRYQGYLRAMMESVKFHPPGR